MRFDTLSSTNQRLIGVIFLLPIVLVFFHSTFAASALVVLLAALMGTELGSMLGHVGGRRAALGLCFAVIALPSSWLDMDVSLHLALIALLTLVSGVLSFLPGQPKLTVFGVSLALCLAATALIVEGPDGNRLMLLLAAVIAACDTAAYFVGRLIGGPKLAPSISPKKTVSGSLGGVVAAIIVMVLAAPVFGISTVMAALAGLGVSIMAQSGDLFESSVKRTLNVKDSGTIIPGHGGVLDRFDGYIFTVPAVFLILL